MLRRIILKFYTRFTSDSTLPLGRWKVEHSPSVLDRKISLATEDNCLGYRTKKILNPKYYIHKANGAKNTGFTNNRNRNASN